MFLIIIYCIILSLINYNEYIYNRKITQITINKNLKILELQKNNELLQKKIDNMQKDLFFYQDSIENHLVKEEYDYFNENNCIEKNVLKKSDIS